MKVTKIEPFYDLYDADEMRADDGGVDDLPEKEKDTTPEVQDKQRRLSVLLELEAPCNDDEAVKLCLQRVSSLFGDLHRGIARWQLLEDRASLLLLNIGSADARRLVAAVIEKGTAYLNQFGVKTIVFSFIDHSTIIPACIEFAPTVSFPGTQDPTKEFGRLGDQALNESERRALEEAERRKNKPGNEGPMPRPT